MNDTKDTFSNKKNAVKYTCKFCNFNTSHKSNYDQHLLTLKHEKLMKRYNKIQTVENTENIKIISNKYVCDICDKVYSYHSGLWRHKKTCKELLSNDNNTIQELKNELAEIKTLLQTQNQIIVSNNNNNNQLANPQLPTSASTNITGDHNNIQNNIFNTQVFLENECKNAVNIDDIIEKVIIDVDKLDVFKEKGTSIGIANILNEVLKSYNIYERPIHCSDVKRLSMHVKDNDIWLSKQQGQEKLSKTIYYIQQSAMKQIYDWEAYYKHKMNPDNLDKGMNLLIKRTTNPLTEDDNKKIIKTIAPNVKLGGGTDVKGTD